MLLTNRAHPQISDDRPDMSQGALHVASRAAWRWNKMLLDQGFTARFNAHVHFPQTHDVARCKASGIMQTIEDGTDIDQAPVFYKPDAMLLSSTSASMWFKMSACAV